MAGYFVMNGELWEDGTAYGCRYQPDAGLVPAAEEDTGGMPRTAPIYFSVSFDCGETAGRWSRARLERTAPDGGSVVFSYLVSDSPYRKGGSEKTLDSYLADRTVPAAEKLRYFKENRSGYAVNPKDILLEQAAGRYLWFLLEFRETGAAIGKLRIDLTDAGMTGYLPEWMRTAGNGDFLNRFLMVFQSMFLDMQERINRFSSVFNPETAQGESLKWIGSWVGCPEENLDEETRRSMIREGFSLYRMRGTKRGMLEALSLVLGPGCGILETFQVMARYPAPVYEERYAALYGRDIRTFIVLIREAQLRDAETLKTAAGLIRRFMPADTKERIVILSPRMVLGGHCYLGMNSALAGNPELRLDNQAMLPFQTSVAEDRNVQEEETRL